MSPDQFYDLRRVQFDISDEFTASDGVQNQFLLLWKRVCFIEQPILFIERNQSLH